MATESPTSEPNLVASWMEKSPEVRQIEQRTRAVAERYIEVWTRGDRAGFVTMFTEDGVLMDPVGTPPWQGRVKIGEFWDVVHSTGATMKPAALRIVVCGKASVHAPAWGPRPLKKIRDARMARITDIARSR